MDRRHGRRPPPVDPPTRPTPNHRDHLTTPTTRGHPAPPDAPRARAHRPATRHLSRLAGRAATTPEFPGPILGRRGGDPLQAGAAKASKRRAAGRPSGSCAGDRRLVVLLLVVVAPATGTSGTSGARSPPAPCATCVAAANGAPYNVLLIGSDSRVGETAAEAQQFGNATNAGGQRSDTIKIVHVDPATGTASTLSIPRDTYVTSSGMPADSAARPAQNKINAAFGSGPDALIQTIENTFGIPISHYIVINFFGVQDAVNALGGISMDFPYPVRDQDCSTGVCYNNSGLNIPTAGCQVLDGTQALALSRSRVLPVLRTTASGTPTPPRTSAGSSART